MKDPAQTLVRWLDTLGRISEEPRRLTRTFLSDAMRRANAHVATLMSKAGLAVHEDATANLIGRLEGPNPQAATLVLGSHLDTVRDAGRFDGALGVLLPIMALAELRRRRVLLPFAVEVVGFSEEEGVRFARAYLGSKGYSRQLAAADRKARDDAGLSAGDVLRQWQKSQTQPPAPRRRGQLLGYVEVHIEQGPVLEQAKLAVGVVSAIAGQTRGRVTFRGRAGHAGTTPMPLRRDALAGAAEFIRFVESTARLRPPLVATVGTIAVSPGAPNVVPGEAVLSLDIRHPRDTARLAALAHLLGEAKALARRRGLLVSWQRTQDDDAVVCDPALSGRLAASVERVQQRSLSLVSGAGHDAVVLSAVTPVAMLFVRCRHGISHHPDEYAATKDIAVALRVMVDFLETLGRELGVTSTAAS